MKKIIMFLAVATIAGISQAASIKWSASNIFNGNTTDKINGGAAYLFAVDSSITAAAAQAYLSGDKTLAEKQAYLANSVANTTTSSGAINYTTDVSLADGTYDFFMVVFDSNPVTDASNFFVSATKTGLEITSVGTANVSIGNQKTLSQNPASFSSVGGGSADPSPEPTSGLLLLVGAGILGLRRKRA